MSFCLFKASFLSYRSVSQFSKTVLAHFLLSILSFILFVSILNDIIPFEWSLLVLFLYMSLAKFYTMLYFRTG